MSIEKRLVKRAKSGNVRACSQLIEKYKNEILFLIYDFLEDYTEATKAAHKAFQRAFDRINEFDDTISFYSCLYREAIDICRITSQTSNKLNETKSQKKQLNENDMVHIGTDNKSEDKTRYRIDRVLHMLPFDQRSVIILRYYHKKTISFIARIMECDEDEVRSKLYQAAEILKPVLSS